MSVSTMYFLTYRYACVSSSWTGGLALKELAGSGISLQSFEILEGCAKKAIKDYTEAGRERVPSDCCLFMQDCFVRCLIFSLRMVVMQLITNLCCNVAPKGTLFAAVLSRGPGNQRLNASYKTSDGYAFQDEVGSSLEEICNAVPGGVLVFFPSYKFLEKLQARWCQTGQWSRLNAQKPLFIEPRNNPDEFESVLKDYYHTIKGNETCANGKTNRGRKKDLKKPQGKHTKDSTKMKGAVFLAVCRGKVSEGVNFSDENARAVVSLMSLCAFSSQFMYVYGCVLSVISFATLTNQVIVGIPFPNINDLQVSLKKKYNATYKSSRSLLNGNEWYCHQAFRALNQAAGLPPAKSSNFSNAYERLQEERNLAYISKWIKQSTKQLDTFDILIQKLRMFFLNAKVDTQAASKSKTFTGRNQSSYEREYIDLEFPMQTPPRWPPLALSDGHSDLGSMMEDSVARNLSYLSATETMVQDHSRLMGRSSFDSDSASNSNDILLEGASTIACSHEKLQADVHSSEVEASLSVSSHYRKRKKMADFQLSACTRPYPFDYPREESCCIFGNENAKASQKDPHVGIRISAENGCLKLEHEESFSLSCDPKNVKKLHVCCSSCRCSLGLRENHFLIPCSLVLSSKFCSSFVLKNGPSIQSPQSLLGTEQMKIPVAITDIANVDQLVLNSHTLDGSPQPDVWSKQDGCVFRSICCPFCGVSDNCLGLQIMATDASNTYLLNKVTQYSMNVLGKTGK
ncbi:hypothetical protein Taro_036488 [Colocasia esculenta]|uniref:ATP-dependent helicase C-terminal domain-containing protein n=1 Tax=Colocasia esculenta TaxID=4460 RepID=A0A843W372_COLES|nr:hypothetical protein [Colocasia esculenta]